MNKNTGIFIGIIAVFLIGAGVYASMGKNDNTNMVSEKTEENKMMSVEESKTEISSTTKDSMMKDESMKDKVMTKGGTYEAFSPEKIAWATEDHDVVLFFRASWCPTCRAADADIKANLNKIPSDLTILDVNYDDSTALKKKYGVTYQHTFVQVDKNGNMIKKWSGSGTLEAIKSEIK